MPRQASPGPSALSVELEAELLRQLAREWAGINETFFKGVLRRPSFGLSDTRARLGQWDPELRSLELSRYLVLEYSWGEVFEVLKHEVAHQFVDEQLNVDEPPHGAAFRTVCTRLGIDAAATHRLGEPGPGPQGASVEGKAHRLVARIQKLLALAESPNQHEAENAATAAQKLMLRFNIDLDKDTPEPGARRYAYKHLGKPSGRTFEHQRRVSLILQEHFFVEAIWVPVFRPRDGKRVSVLEICGSQANLEIAEHVHAFLHATGERLWAQYKREQGITANADRRTFLAGVMGGFEAKLDAQKASFQREGLVWVPNAELGRYLRQRHPYVQRVRSGGAQRNEAFAEGHKAGGRIVLSQPVRSGASSRGPRALKSGGA